MISDKKLFLFLLILIGLPVALAAFGNDRFRYPCQDPNNWETKQCQKPLCDVTRTCPEHIFKGQRDPRLGPPETRVEPIGQICQQCQPDKGGNKSAK